MLVYGILGCFLSALTTSKFFPGPCHDLSCLNGGVCYSGPNSTHWCRCSDQFKGDQCELSACTRECQNHGICYVNASGVLSCKCPLGYDGKHCERIVKNICHRESPCGLHGTCLLTTSLEDYECNCHKGWTGPDCSQRDLCPLDYCSNGGKCRRDQSEFVCDCPHNYHGNQCELDVNECDQDLCVHGKCVNTVGSYRCECYDNFIGADCQISRNEEDCTVFGPKSCRNGGVCNTENNNYTCICPHTYDGHFCERDVDECATTNLCQNGGTCVNSEGGFSCLCTAAFEGELCTVNKDDCVYNKCAAGSTCVDEIGKYRCECPTGIIGTLCQHADQCSSHPCKNGHCLSDPNSGNYSCTCDTGYTGVNCDVDIDECAEWAATKCYHGATCVNIPGSYFCECPAGLTGNSCQYMMDYCHPNPCLNNGICIDRYDSFECSCAPEFTGVICDEHCSADHNCSLESCQRNGCENGGLCRMDGCECPAGFSGVRCENKLRACEMMRCPEGQICIENNITRAAICKCPLGYYGYDCQREVDECASNPCQHGGTCADKLNDYECSCSKGYSGKNCELSVDHCFGNPCRNGGQCINAAEGIICHCSAAYFGEKCQFKRDPCSRSRCDNGALCRPNANYRNYTCGCRKGYEGKYCEQDINECLDNPCRNGGTCHNSHGSYRCICPQGYSGINCFENIDDCAKHPCLNNGTCIDELADFRCLCQSGFTGKSCGVDIDDCAFNPCLNGATCVDGVNRYECLCRPGFSGRDCHINDDDCRPGLCLNDGRCVDGVDDYKCECPRGYTGKNCQLYVDVDKFNYTDMMEYQSCVDARCDAKAQDGKCDSLCNYFACGFDGGDCSAKADPYSNCNAPSYCSHVFHDGKCDEICNNESCLFDGFDCERPPSRCPSQIQNYCRIHYADGTCDDQCNLAGCGYDGGDCDGPKKNMLSGDVVIVVLTEQSEFVRQISKFLMTLSKKLRASVKIKNDKDGPMIYEWDGEEGNRITIPTGQILEVNYSGKIRLRRSTSQQGVIVWVQIDVSECRGDCFSNVNTVASYLGAANAKQDLAELGMPIYEAIARHPDIPSPNSTDSFFGMVILGLGLMIVVATVFVLQQRTRKRRMIEAPVWKIPTEAQSKLCSMSQNEQMLRNGFYHDLFGAKRSRHENMNYYQPDPFHESATPFQTERVEAVTVKKKLQPSANLLHEQAASDMPIELPIDTSLVNVRGPFGRTPLIFLADNTVKTEEQLIEDAQNLIDAGANANIQDDDEETAIFVATRAGKRDFVKKMLEIGADPTIMNRTDSTCLHQAAANCDLRMVQELLKHKAVVKEIDVCDSNDRTALMLNAMNDNIDSQIATALISAGADHSYPGDKSAISYTGRTALHYAAQYNNVHMIEFLISKEANKDAQDLEDRTPVFLAASEGHVEAVRALAKAGASLEITDQKDRTPYKVAKENEWIHIMELLETEENTTIIPLHMTIGKNTVKNGTKPIKRIPVKRKPQPLTPPHSDGCMSTPSPHDAFQLARPVGSVLDSPVSEHLGSINNAFSPTDNGISMTRPSYWTNDVSASSTTKHSPPYDYPDLGASSYYSNYSLQYNSSSSYSSSQSYQPGPSNTTVNQFLPSCQYSQQNQVYYSHHV